MSRKCKKQGNCSDCIETNTDGNHCPLSGQELD